MAATDCPLAHYEYVHTIKHGGDRIMAAKGRWASTERQLSTTEQLAKLGLTEPAKQTERS